MLWRRRRGREAESFLTADTSRWVWAKEPWYSQAPKVTEQSPENSQPRMCCCCPTTSGVGETQRGNSVLAAISCNRNYSPWKPRLHLEPFTSRFPRVLRAINPTGLALSVFPRTEQLFGSSAAASVQDNGISGCRVGSHTEQPTALLWLLHLGAHRGFQGAGEAGKEALLLSRLFPAFRKLHQR